MKTVFIDGSAGTTGLRIHERLTGRNDIKIATLPDALRKDPAARKAALNEADIVMLCLPDAASIEAVSMIENPAVAVIDTSTAHRVAEGWTYGFAELQGQREKIIASKRIANPGCHASGFISLAAPLVAAGIVSPDANLSCFSLTGYSGGGKKMIAEYEADELDPYMAAPRMYGISQAHKHLPEMKKLSGLNKEPVFCPIVSTYYSGMEVTLPLFASEINGTIEDVRSCLREYYKNGLVHYADAADEAGFVSAGAYSGRDDMEISVYGNEERILVVSRFDNLGKGASGAAIQNLNLLLGVDEKTSLNA